jgi:hypothetical protein
MLNILQLLNSINAFIKTPFIFTLTNLIFVTLLIFHLITHINEI